MKLIQDWYIGLCEEREKRTDNSPEFTAVQDEQL